MHTHESVHVLWYEGKLVREMACCMLEEIADILLQTHYSAANFSSVPFE